MAARARVWPLGVALLAALAGAVMVQLAYATEPYVPLIALLSLGVVALAVARPMLALFLAIALVPLQPFTVPVGSTGLAASEALLLVTAAGWTIKSSIEGRALFGDSPLGKPLAAMLVVMLPGVALAVEAFPVARMLVWWTVAVLLHHMVSQDGDLTSVRRLLFSLSLAGAVVGAVTIVQSLGSAPPDVEGFGTVVVGRPTGPFEHANGAGGFLAMALPAALVLGLKGRVGLRPVAIASAGLMLAGLMLSLSRGGLLGAAAALAFLLLWKPFRRATVVIALVIALLVMSGVGPLADAQPVKNLGLRISSISYSTQPGADPRGALWSRTGEMIEDHLALGVGVGAYSTVASRYGIYAAETGEEIFHAHNTPLTVAAETGLLGLLAFGWACVVLVQLLARACRRTSGEAQAFSFAISAALLSVAVHGLVDFTLGSIVRTALVLALAGSAVALLREAQAPERSEPAEPSTA